jgi:hypothetical protein
LGSWFLSRFKSLGAHVNASYKPTLRILYHFELFGLASDPWPSRRNFKPAEDGRFSALGLAVSSALGSWPAVYEIKTPLRILDCATRALSGSASQAITTADSGSAFLGSTSAGFRLWAEPCKSLLVLQETHTFWNKYDTITTNYGNYCILLSVNNLTRKEPFERKGINE